MNNNKNKVELYCSARVLKGARDSQWARKFTLQEGNWHVIPCPTRSPNLHKEKKKFLSNKQGIAPREQLDMTQKQ